VDRHDLQRADPAANVEENIRSNRSKRSNRSNR
jgi:hypothetical protein